MKNIEPALLAATLLAAANLHAQGIPPAGQDDYLRLTAAMQAAQAAAYRAGDESLDCGEIVAEIQSTVDDPAYQAYIAESGAAAQQELALMQNPYAAAQPSPAQAQQAMAAQQAQTEKVIAVMPQVMRMQRLVELAAIKACDWTPPGISVDATDP